MNIKQQHLPKITRFFIGFVTLRYAETQHRTCILCACLECLSSSRHVRTHFHRSVAWWLFYYYYCCEGSVVLVLAEASDP
jgi:hypothetical protein